MLLRFCRWVVGGKPAPWRSCISQCLCFAFLVLVDIQQEEDFQFEEELSRNPYSVKTWWQYLDFKHDASPAVSFVCAHPPHSNHS